MHARALPGLGPPAFCGRRFPDLEYAAQAHENDGFGQTGISGQLIRQHDAALFVGFDRESVGIQRGGKIVVRLAE